MLSLFVYVYRYEWCTAGQTIHLKTVRVTRKQMLGIFNLQEQLAVAEDHLVELRACVHKAWYVFRR
jgi:hypothetical protein